MNTLSQVLEANKCFVFQSKIDSYTSISKVSKVPSRSIAILSCMDTRLVDFLEPALGIKRGEAKVIKNAGNSVTGPFSATIRNLLISIFELGVNEVLVIGHLDCGMAHVTSSELIAKMRDRGISQDAISMVDDELKVWLGLFHHPVENVRHVVSKIRSNPLIPCDVPIHGLMFDPHSGEIEVIVNGYGQSL